MTDTGTDTIVVHISNYEQWRNQIRVFRALLGNVLDNTAFTYRSKGAGWQCPYCDEISPLLSKNRSETVHTDDCLYRQIERALAADETEIARLAALDDPS